jgi:hypothetical protein
MTDAVPARIALAYLATLSADLRSALVLDAAGGVIAGDAGLQPDAERLLDGAQTGQARRTPHGEGTLFAARSDAHLLALAVGPHALEAVVVHDLLATLDDLRDC